MKTLIVLPSYNERLQILDLTQAILDENPENAVCIVDDSSPDGTASSVAKARQERAGWSHRVHLIVRTKKDGRGSAVREGFTWGVERKQFEAYVEMDCDFSHEPGALHQGLALLQQGFDVVIGARYPNGTIIDWPLSRRVFSFCANLLARTLIDRRIPDYTNGFRFYSPSAVKELLQHEQKCKGYIYLSETLSHLLRAGYKVSSFPIRFKNRERGASNTTLNEICSAFVGIFTIAVDYHRDPR